MTIEFENDRVRVTRVKASGPERGRHSHEQRGDRLVVYLRDGHVERMQDGQRDTLRRRAGDVIWRDASEHAVVVPHANDHEVLIIELKDQVA